MLHCGLIFIVALSGLAKADENAEAAEVEVSKFGRPSKTGNFFDIIKGKVYTNYQFGVLVNRKERLCYYQVADNSTLVQVNFEATGTKISATSDRISASIIFLGEELETLQSFYEKKQGKHTLVSEKAGLYALCLDATKSRWPYFVQVTMDIWRDGNIDEVDRDSEENNDTMHKIYDALYGIIMHMLDAKSSITSSFSKLRGDYITSTSNLGMIDFYSTSYIVIVTVICFIQLYVTKRMFPVQKGIVV